MLEKVYETTISAIGQYRQYRTLIPERRETEHHNHINHLVAPFGEKDWEEKTQKSKQVNTEIKDEVY